MVCAGRQWQQCLHPCSAARGCGPELAPERVRVRGAIPQSPVLPRLTPTSRFLHRITNAGCRSSGTPMELCGVTSLPASYQRRGRARRAGG